MLNEGWPGSEPSDRTHAPGSCQVANEGRGRRGMRGKLISATVERREGGCGGGGPPPGGGGSFRGRWALLRAGDASAYTVPASTSASWVSHPLPSSPSTRPLGQREGCNRPLPSPPPTESGEPKPLIEALQGAFHEGATTYPLRHRGCSRVQRG